MCTPQHYSPYSHKYILLFYCKPMSELDILSEQTFEEFLLDASFISKCLFIKNFSRNCLSLSSMFSPAKQKTIDFQL